MALLNYVPVYSHFYLILKGGQKVEIKNSEQMMYVTEFVQLHGFDESVSVSEDEKTVYKHKFLNEDYG